MSQPKVFEYAKEKGFEPLALMAKIKEWGLPVKSHMVELDESTIQEIEKRLAVATATSTSKASVTKRKAVAKAKVAPIAVKSDESANKKVSKKAKKSTVIRRKKEEPEEAEEVVQPEEIVSVEIEEIAAAPVVEVVEAVAPVVEPPPAPPAEVVAKPVVEEKPENKQVVARKVAVNVADGVSSGFKSVPKNIIGRMDLKRVTSTSTSAPRTPSASGSSGAQTPAKPLMPGEVRQPRTGKRNIRTGFVAAPSFGEASHDDERKKELEEKKLAKKAGVGREGEAVVFSTAEFRKREMVFQPKKKKGLLNREARKTAITTPKASKRVVRVNESISVSDLAMEMGVKSPQLIKLLMKNGIMANVNQVLDFETVALLVPELGWEAINVHRSVDELLADAQFGGIESDVIIRPPVVTVMGHVDHGKTTLLDAIRKANVAKGEAGGITQHIAAYSVTIEGDKKITFIDTPGHEAFTAMRARGANVTDIAVIVVAADDGVMPQTAEAINHVKAAKVPIIVAVNKIDKPGANSEKIKRQLTEFELVPEEWGGTTIFVEVSALNGQGIDKLLEQITVLAEVSELKANPKKSGTGVVLESRMEKGRGYVSTLLVKDGTVKVGQYIVAGTITGKIKSSG